MFRAAAVVLLVIAAMVTIKDGRPLRGTGLIASCSAVPTPAGQDGYWQACRPGKLEGRPDLKRQSCESVSVSAGVEYWRCPSPVESAPAGQYGDGGAGVEAPTRFELVYEALQASA